MAKKSKKASKKKEAHIKAQKENKFTLHFHYILVALVAVLLFYPSYFRGLFFDGEMLLTQAFVFLLFIAFLVYWLLIRRGGELLKSPLDYVLLAFCVFYAFSLIGAVVPREAWLELMAVFTYFLVFLLVSRLSGWGNYKWFMYALILGAVGVSFIGVGVGFGSFDFPGAERGNRIYSSLQYPNTTAALLTAGFFVALGRIEGEKRYWLKALMGGAAFFMLVTFVFTMSRAAWLMFPIVLVIYWGLNVRKFVSTFIYTAIPGAVFLAVAMPIWEAIQESEALGWYYVGGGVVVSSALTFIFSYLFGGLERLQKKGVQYVVVGVLAIALLGGAGYGATNYEAALERMPEVVSERIDRIDFEERSFELRVDFMRAAWDITTDRPVVGAGGGGWESLYHQYLERDYWTTEVHSHLFQVGVESGLPGMLVFAGAWIALIYQFGYILIKKRGEGTEYAQATGIFVGALALGGHSMVDFNLSLGAVAIYLWALLGLLNYYYLSIRYGEEDLGGESAWAIGSLGKNRAGAGSGNGGFGCRFSERLNRYFPYAAGVVVFFFMIYSLVIYHGFSAGERAGAFAERGMLEEALRSYETAISNDHLNAELHFDLVSTYEEIYRHTGEDRFIVSAIETAERAIELNPYYPPHLRRYGQFMLRVGNIDEGLEHLVKGYRYQPHGDTGYKVYASGLVSASEHYLKEGDREEANKHLERVLELREEFLEYHSVDREFDINVFKAYVFLEEYEKALEFMEDDDVSIPGGEEGSIFRALAYLGSGDEERAGEIIEDTREDLEEEEEYEEAESVAESYEEYVELLGLGEGSSE